MEALKRAAELKQRIQDYLQVEKDIETGFKNTEKAAKQKKRILEVLGADEQDWLDWHWQMDNRITDVDTLAQIVTLDDDDRDIISEIGKTYRWAISPYYASLMNPDSKACPIRWLAIPSVFEYSEEGELDPMDEEHTSPVSGVTRRYPDRLIIKVTNQCAMYCRHCQRRRLIGETDNHAADSVLKEAIN